MRKRAVRPLALVIAAPDKILPLPFGLQKIPSETLDLVLQARRLRNYKYTANNIYLCGFRMDDWRRDFETVREREIEKYPDCFTSLRPAALTASSLCAWALHSFSDSKVALLCSCSSWWRAENAFAWSLITVF